VFGIIVLLHDQILADRRTDGLTCESRILWYTEEFMVDSVDCKLAGPVAAKQACAEMIPFVFV